MATKTVICSRRAGVEAAKAVWNRHDLVAAIARHLPENLGGLEGFEVRALVEGITDRALTQVRDSGVVPLTVPEIVPVPEELRRRDGRSQFEPHRPDRYATRAQLDREESLVATARQTGAVKVPEEELEKLLDTTGLSGDQRAAAGEILGSGKRLQVLIGPAGTGKSYTVGTVAERPGQNHQARQARQENPQAEGLNNKQ